MHTQTCTRQTYQADVRHLDSMEEVIPLEERHHLLELVACDALASGLASDFLVHHCLCSACLQSDDVQGVCVCLQVKCLVI
jgi:hypothetical protein